MKAANKLPNHERTVINGKSYFPLKKQYRGALNKKHLPEYHANTWLLQSLAGCVHFHYALN